MWQMSKGTHELTHRRRWWLRHQSSVFCHQCIMCAILTV